MKVWRHNLSRQWHKVFRRTLWISATIFKLVNQLIPIRPGNTVLTVDKEPISICGYATTNFCLSFVIYCTNFKGVYYFIAESYLEYFTTPYFIFVRDTLSYLTLLGLHFALCLAPSSIPFSGLEWVILVFFMGRILMESKQFLNVKTQNAHLRREDIDANKQIGYDPKKGGGNEDNQNNQVSRSTLFLKKCGKYLR